MNPVDFLISIPGPFFLVGFAVFSTICIIIGRYLALMDGSVNDPLPDAGSLDHIEIAAMRGGRAAAVQTAIFELWQQKILVFSDGSCREMIRVESAEKPAPSFQAAIYSFFREKKQIADLFKNTETMDAATAYLESAYQKLEMMNLITSARDRSRIIFFFFITLIPVFGTGLTKLYFGLKFGRPVAFLVVLLFMVFTGLLISFKPFKKRRMTKLGIKYIEYLKNHFSWLRQAVSNNDEIPSFNPALFGVAIFGVTFLAGMEMFTPFSSAFPVNLSGDSFSGSSYDSSGNSSGDSGGSGCSGGGCGGCGGGGD